MKKLYFAALLGFGLVATTNAQSLERQVIGAAGGFDTGGGVSLSYTVGEPVVETAISGSVILTQGFQQPDDLNVGIKEEIKVTLQYTVFPNPTDDKIYIDLNSEKVVDVILSLYDISGKKFDYLTSQVNVNGKTRTEMSLKMLASGQYILVLNDKSGNSLQNFKIQKLN